VKVYTGQTRSRRAIEVCNRFGLGECVNRGELPPRRMGSHRARGQHRGTTAATLAVSVHERGRGAAPGSTRGPRPSGRGCGDSAARARMSIGAGARPNVHGPRVEPGAAPRWRERGPRHPANHIIGGTTSSARSAATSPGAATCATTATTPRRSDGRTPVGPGEPTARSSPRWSPPARPSRALAELPIKPLATGRGTRALRDRRRGRARRRRAPSRAPARRRHGERARRASPRHRRAADGRR